MVAIPHTFSDGDVILASQLNGNFSALASRTIRNADVAEDAAIDRAKLAQRFVPCMAMVSVLPYSQSVAIGVAGGANDPANYTGLDASWSELKRFYFRVPSGATAFLCALDLFVDEAANSPEMRFLVDSVVLGDSALTVASGTKYSVARTNPFANPLIPISNNSVLSIQAQDGSGAGSSELRGVDITIHTKQELIA